MSLLTIHPRDGQEVSTGGQYRWSHSAVTLPVTAPANVVPNLPSCVLRLCPPESNSINYDINSLVRAPLAKVDHGLPELLLANTAVVIVVEHPEGRLHVVQLVAAAPENLLADSQEVALVHGSLPVTVSLETRE